MDSGLVSPNRRPSDGDMEEHEDMEEDSTSNVEMVESHGTFIPVTTDGTVRIP